MFYVLLNDGEQIIMKTANILFITAVLSGFLLSGCGSSRQGVAPARSNTLLAKEFEDLNARNMYEVIEQLRPRWLFARGGMRSFQLQTHILVYQENVRLGTVEVLRDIAPDMVRSVEYIDGPKASATLPGIRAEHVAGAIIITPTTKRY
jgi:outer membrane murein-binding lipoprotein Lpp